MASTQIARVPRAPGPARKPPIIDGRLVEPQVTTPVPRHPSVTRLIAVFVSVGVVAIVGFGVLYALACAQ